MALPAIPVLLDIGASIVKTVGSIFGGDKVPNYPIKSKASYDRIVADIKRNIPNPTSVEDAKVLLNNAHNYLNVQLGLDGSVTNQTYIMMYQEVIKALEEYIRTNGTMGTTTQGGYTTTPSSQTAGASFFESTAGIVVLVLLGLIVVGSVIYFASRSKKK